MNANPQPAAIAAAVPSNDIGQPADGRHILPPLPYADDALEPVISANTLRLHHGAHHKAYVDTLNELVDRTPFAALSLREIMLTPDIAQTHPAILHNAAQAWNHAFYWRSLTPAAPAIPTALRQAINTSFGGLESLKKALGAAAIAQFGSGWAWLALDGSRLRVVPMSNADNPLTARMRPLLTIDVWEHAYYLDYQNRRADYIHFVVEKLLNWEFASENLRA